MRLAPPGSACARLDIGYIEISPNITLRRMVVQNSNPRGTVLFLHGFPETLCVWKEISLALADDYEVHAFDWPGYGFSSRPPAARFSYAPKEYVRVLHDYIEKANVDESKLTIYATDIGALPALLLALEKPDIAKKIIVGDFAPFNRPQYMYESSQNLKSEPSAGKTRAYMNQTRAEILENAFGARKTFTSKKKWASSWPKRSRHSFGFFRTSVTTPTCKTRVRP